MGWFAFAFFLVYFSGNRVIFVFSGVEVWVFLRACVFLDSRFQGILLTGHQVEKMMIAGDVTLCTQYIR